MIIDALTILSGGRFSKEMIRHGQKNSYVEMSLFLPKINKEENIIISREINLTGKNICKINGRLVTVSQLKEFMNKIIDIHGQNENQSLLEVSNHLKLLDKFAGGNIDKLKEEYKKLYFRHLEINKTIKENFGEEKERQRMLDLLKYQLNEIKQANLKVNEEEELYEKRKAIINSEKISSAINLAKNLLSQNIIDDLSNTIKEMDKISEYNLEYQKISERLRNCYYELQESEIDLSSFENNIDFNEEQQNKIEERIELINSLKRKYGNNIEEILKFSEEINLEIDKIENNEEYIKQLKNELNNIKEKMMDYAKEISNIRKEAGIEISKKINKELKDLEMKKAEFEVRINTDDKNYNCNGIDSIEFLISTNIGTDKKPLNKIASGGEMSRIMLAIKNVLADIDETPIIVFDEIDTGISGNAGVITGEKIKNISKKHQVICITHLASIAAKGDYNYYIYKETEENETKTKVRQLEEDEILKEIARISSGSITQISLNLAKQLRGIEKIA
ncbi:MAG: DNA repair protein RecN [Candidatus Scatovivens sp.]